MSFREVRNLAEQLRVLGFPRQVSVENFSVPNLPLVSEILTWAAATVDGDHQLPSTIDTEEERVTLIRLATIFFYQRLGLQLSSVRLYGGDRLAVRQLLKITTWLYKSTLNALPVSSILHSEDNNDITQVSIKDLREVRQLASTIIMDAACLADRLALEVDNKMIRVRAEKQGLDLDRAEATMVAALHAQAAALTQLQDVIQGLRDNTQEVEEKIQKKSESLARNSRRLDALLKIKPSWQHEFEEEEEELKSVWNGYITRHRTLAYLEGQIDSLHTQQLEAARRKVVRVGCEGAELATPQPAVKEMMLRLLGGLRTDCSSDTEWPDSVLEDSDSSFTLDSPTSVPALSPTHSTANTGLPHKVNSSFAPPGSSLHHPTRSTPDIDCSKSVHSTSDSPALAQPAIARPPAARPKNSPRQRRGSSLNVRARERVSPLSASDDNLSDYF